MVVRRSRGSFLLSTSAEIFMNRLVRSLSTSLCVAGLLLACSIERGEEAPAAPEADLRALSPSEIVGALVPNQPSAPIPYVDPPLYRALSFQGAANQTVDVDVRSTDGDAVAW